MSIPEIAGGTAAIYVLVLIILRLLGKKGLSELSIGDLVLIILIGEALGSLIPQENAFVSAVTCIITLGIVNFIIEKAVFKSKKFRVMLEGIPVIIVKDGKVVKKNMEDEKLPMESLEEAIRSNGLRSIKEVEIAILETDGEISIIEKKGP